MSKLRHEFIWQIFVYGRVHGQTFTRIEISKADVKQKRSQV